MTGTRVRDYMTCEPVVLDVSQTLLDAAIVLKKSGFRHLPIVQGGALVGMISDRDIARLSPTMLLPHSAEEHHKILRHTVVGAVMTREPMSTSPNAPLAEAVDLMRRHKLGSLAVLDEGTLVGIVTTRDMLRALHDCLSAVEQAA